MVSALISRLVVLTAGTLYPAYRSYKAVRTKDVREYVKWMMYWIVFAAYLGMIFKLPDATFLVKMTPKFIHPTLSKHERDIDQYLDRAKNEGYSTIVRLGSRSLLYAREVVASAAIRGQAQLIHQLRKSYSLNDISRDEDEFQEQQALEFPDSRQSPTRRRSTTSGHRLRIEEIKEEPEEEDEEVTHSDGEEERDY